MKSHALAISQPDPTTGPSTTATTGIGSSSMAAYTANALMRRARIWSSLISLRSFRSAPAQNTGPLARMSSTWTSSRARTSRIAVCRSWHNCVFKALRAWGRFRVRVATWFSRDSVTLSSCRACIVKSLLRYAGPEYAGCHSPAQTGPPRCVRPGGADGQVQGYRARRIGTAGGSPGSDLLPGGRMHQTRRGHSSVGRPLPRPGA
ncbi:hypothetical protein D3C80_1468100 [compost metagenome]